MPIYTKKGDKGTTSLPYDQRKHSKSHYRVRALGEVDELNSVVGSVIAFLKDGRIANLLLQVQHDLFRIQMELASKGRVFKEKGITPITPEKVHWLEKQIDEMERKLVPISKFILPGGSPAGALCQLARAVCRRVEREVAALKERGKVNPEVVKYLNRLSDFLFVTARFINKKEGQKEVYPDYYANSSKR